jgi:hypothetical protein
MNLCYKVTEYVVRPLGCWLGSRVRIPLRAWMLVSCLYAVLFCVGRGLCDGLVTRPEESYLMYNCMCDRRNPERGPMFQLGTKMKINE